MKSKTVLALLLAALTARMASGLTCAPPSIEIWPTSGTVPRNVVWVLDGADRAGELHLVGGGETIGLTVTSAAGGLDGRQVLLRPAVPLRPGVEYRIPWPGPNQGNAALGPWLVSATEDVAPPAFRRAPVVEYRFRGSTWGISRTARFDVDATEPALPFVTIEADGSAEVTALFLLPRSRTTLLTGPCGGNFSFQPLADRFTGTVRLLDAAGNWSSGKGEPYSFNTTAELRPLQRTGSDLASSALPRPRKAADIFDDEQWDDAARYITKHPQPNRAAAPFVPYDPTVLQRLSFLGMPEEIVRRLLGRGGQPLSPSPVFAAYVYAMVPPPTGYELRLELRIDYDDDMRLVVVNEAFLPTLFGDPEGR